MSFVEDCVASRWFWPALSCVALLLLVTVLLGSFKLKQKSPKPRSRSLAGLGASIADPNAGSVFVEDSEGHVVRRGARCDSCDGLSGLHSRPRGGSHPQYGLAGCEKAWQAIWIMLR
jgi:hypothetical protein